MENKTKQTMSYKTKHTVNAAFFIVRHINSKWVTRANLEDYTARRLFEAYIKRFVGSLEFSRAGLGMKEFSELLEELAKNQKILVKYENKYLTQDKYKTLLLYSKHINNINI